MLKTVIRLLLLAVVPALGSFAWHAAAGRLPAVGPEVTRVRAVQAGSWSGVLWIDARGETDYEESHVPEALPLRESNWSQDLPAVLDRWQPGMRVVVYCGGQSCEASETVAQRIIRETGWRDVFVLEGGWDAWQARGK